jgi:hypothetical protein
MSDDRSLRVVDGGGRLYAHGTATCLLLAPAAKP